MERIKNNFPKILVWTTAFLFFILPFFWFKPGEMDLGGDSSRLYFYDPLAYLKNYAFYGVSPSGFGGENIGYFMVPFVSFLLILKLVIGSSTFLIAGFHGMSFAIAFLSVYFIVIELLSAGFKKESVTYVFSAFFAALIYCLSQISILGWDKVLVTHNLFFLNPLIFFLLLKYFKTNKKIFLAIFLVITFIFAPNFSFVAAPGFFAFYPLSIIYLFIYRIFFLKRKIIWHHILISFIMFILLQTFHIFPQMISMLSKGSVLNTTIFSDAGKLDRGLNYFSAIAPNIKVSLNLMLLPQMTSLNFFSFFFIIIPLVICIGLILNKSKLVLLTSIFFLIVLFFSTANITNLGLEFYKKLFYLPGFSIFRNFYGQWGYALLFFYSILFGQISPNVFSYIKNKYRSLVFLSISVFLILSASSFIDGSLVNKIIWQSNNKHIFMKIDPKYEEMLTFIHSLPVDGKILTLPLSDPGYQIISGVNNGAYQGPSTISYLAGKQDFAGLDEFGQYKEVFVDCVVNEKYIKLKKLLGMLNIKYIFYNADPEVYDEAFPTFPYSDVRRYLPINQKEYKNFLNELSVKEIKNISNKYYVFEINNNDYYPKVFITNHSQYFTKNIDNWDIPLSFDEKEIRNIFETSQVPLDLDQSFIELDKRNVFTRIIKNPDQPRFLHNSFAKIGPSSLLYKPSVIKEYITLQKGKDSFRYVDNRLFLSAKLIYELEQWGHDMKISREDLSTDELITLITNKKDKRSLLWEIDHSDNYWSDLLTRYVKNFSESIEYINNSNEDLQWKQQEKFLIYEYYLNHQLRFTNLLAGSNMPSDEKLQLNQLIDKIFEFILNDLQLPDLRNSINQYEIPVVDNKNITETLYMDKVNFSKFDKDNFSLSFNGRDLALSNDQDENLWEKFDTNLNDLRKPGVINVVTINQKDLMKNAEFMTIKPYDQDLYTKKSLNSIPELTWKSGMLWSSEWQEDSYYLLTFDYMSGGVPYSVRMYEQSIQNKDLKTNLLFQNQLKSRLWTTYQAVVHSSKSGKNVFVQIGGDSIETPISQLKIRNIELLYLPQPKLIVKTTNKNLKRLKLPTINFVKINPTKYLIRVKNSSDPYYLIFNQSFNNRWQLFLSRGNIQESKNVGSYLGGKVFEALMNNNVINLNLLETLNEQSIFNNVHYSVNGNANAWYIDQSKVGNSQSQTYILELTTQRYFYIGLIISLITFVGVLLYLIYLFIKHEK